MKSLLALLFLLCPLAAVAQAPKIAQQPKNCYAALGAMCTISVEATGDNLTYQWYHGASGDTSTASTTAGYNTCCHALKVYTAPACRWVRVTNPFGIADSKVACAEVSTSTTPPSTAYNGPKYDHIVILVDENHDYGEIIGHPTNAPYINNVLVKGGASFSEYHAITHPSQPNYFAIYSGSTQGVKDDATHAVKGATIDTVLKAAGKHFRGFVETGSPRKHNPWESFPEGTSVEANFTTFPQLAAGFENLPQVSWVVPSLQHDMHDGTILMGDTWLKTNLDAYAQWAKSHNSLLIVTFDEGEGSTSGVETIIPTVFYGANIVPGKYTQTYTHYSTLKTVLAAFGLASSAPLNGASATPVNGAVFKK